ncbi:MAG: hypothetical protein QNI90_08825 [Dinoroseobacter sp.]|nr:hypothetical protein [Dinoroseobacter sp.]
MVSPKDDESQNSSGLNESDEERMDKLIGYLQRIGLPGFATDIRMQESNRKLLELYRQADYYEVVSMVWGVKLDRHIQDSIAIQSSLQEKSSIYNTVIISLGYASFFGIWQHVSPNLTFQENAFLGVLLGISILFFVGWTIYTIIYQSRHALRYIEALDVEFESLELRLQEFDEVNHKIRTSALRVQKYWTPIFVISLATGFLAGVLLIVTLFFGVLEIYWSPILELLALFGR